jgi:uncharacterized protein YggE
VGSVRLRLLALTLFLAVLAPPAHAQTSERTLTVLGTGSATAPNDTARVTFRVVRLDRDPAVALNATSKRTRRVIAAVLASGIAGEDIVTREASLQRVTRRRGGRREFVGYRAVNSVAVTVREVAQTGPVIVAGVRAGAASFSTKFSYSASSALYDQALAGAYRDAQRKAELLADEAGVTLGDPLAIHEGFPDVISEFDRTSDELAAQTPPPIRPGITRVEAGVTVRYAISG